MIDFALTYHPPCHPGKATKSDGVSIYNATCETPKIRPRVLSFSFPNRCLAFFNSTCEHFPLFNKSRQRL